MYFSTYTKKSKEGIYILEYYRPFKTIKGYTVSVDKIAVDYMMETPAALNALGRLLEMLSIRHAVETCQWTTYKIGAFRENFTITFQNKNSFWLGVGLNGVKTEWNRVRLEFNPNKCASHASFLAVLSFLNENTRPMHTAVRRFDLAVDVPTERENVRIVKDGRVFSERRHGKEWTEYLGAKASHVGRVKLYNKRIEAGLSYPLTRLEVTLDPATPYEKLAWPKVYYVQRQQIDIGEMNLTDTERFILSALLAGYGTTKDLGRKTREKMDRVMSTYVEYIEITKQEYALVLACLREFLDYPKKDLKISQIDGDQPPAPRATIPTWVQAAEKAGAMENGK